LISPSCEAGSREAIHPGGFSTLFLEGSMQGSAADNDLATGQAKTPVKKNYGSKNILCFQIARAGALDEEFWMPVAGCEAGHMSIFVYVSIGD
jgi:hypothetical protein